MELQYSRYIFEKILKQTIKTRPMGAEFFHAVTINQTRHDEAKSHFSQLYESTYKLTL